MTDKSWAQAKRDKNDIFKTGDYWTLLAVECYMCKDCKKCIYWRYCEKNILRRKPIMKHAALISFEKFGKPPEYLIDKIDNIILI